MAALNSTSDEDYSGPSHSSFEELLPGGEYELQTIKVHSEMRESPDSPEYDNLFEEVEFPPKPPVNLDLQSDMKEETLIKHVPLTYSKFKEFLDSDGRLIHEHAFRQAVFKGGVSPEVRKDAWRFLFGLYPVHSTVREREILRAEYYLRYRELKKRWNKVLLEQADTTRFLHPGYLRANLDESYGEELENSINEICQGEAEPSLCLPDLPSPDIRTQLAFMDLQAQLYAARQDINSIDKFLNDLRIIDKDVPRTDRDWPYFRGVDNPHLRELRDILITFSAFHPKIGYAQGMNDILSRFLVVLDNEVEAYWCFTKHMENVQADFLPDGLHRQLRIVRQLLEEVDPDECHYLNCLGVGDMTFCHRWMLLSFKREFDQEDCLRCFEILFSHHMELSSMEAEKIRSSERRKDFANQGGKSRVEEAPMNTDFTFDVFVCVTILVENRDKIFKCTDTSDIFELVSKLSKQMDLTDLLAKSERLFHRYCRRSVLDCFQMVELPSPGSCPDPSNGKSGKVSPKQKETERNLYL